MAFGMTLTGFVKKPLATIIDELQTKQRLDVDPALTFGSEEPLTQLNGTFAEQLAQVWELGEVLAAIDPDSASGFRVDQISQITGTVRDGATFSEVVIDCTFSGITTLTAGVQSMRHDTIPSIVFVVKTTFTSAGAGVEAVTFIATVAGPVQAAAGLVTTIVTPAAGWTSGTNPADAVPGEDRENDSELKEKRSVELASGGGASFPTLLSKLSKVTGVTSVNLINNRTNDPDADNVPGHSVEAVVVGGSDADVAQALFDNASAGTGFFGTTDVTITDSQGFNHLVSFTRPTVVQIWMTFVLNVDGSYIGTAAHELLIAALDANYDPGDDVFVLGLLCDAIDDVAGIVNPVSLDIGLSFGSQFPVDLTIDPRSIVDFDTARIDITANVV